MKLLSICFTTTVNQTATSLFITAYQKQNLKLYLNHKKSFNHEKHKNNTQLSNELWKIKASKEEPVLVWKILGQYQPYIVNTKRCLLCLNEKLKIAIYRGNNMLEQANWNNQQMQAQEQIYFGKLR